MGGNFHIRLGTITDVDQLVDLHCRIFDVTTHHLLLLGPRFMNHVFHWYCQAPNAFTLLAENEAGVVGYIAVNQGSYYMALRENWKHVLAALVRKPVIFCMPLMVHRLKALLRSGVKADPTFTHRACLAFLAVDMAKRVKGVAPALVLRAVDECKARGWDEVVTSMHRNNTPARYLYSSLGFENYPQLNVDDLVSVRINANTQTGRRVGES
jgi:ribosomal protein S18 acetylase RimI-like enzyme